MFFFFFSGYPLFFFPFKFNNSFPFSFSFSFSFIIFRLLFSLIQLWTKKFKLVNFVIKNLFLSLLLKLKEFLGLSFSFHFIFFFFLKYKTNHKIIKRSIFCDFGANFVVTDVNGENPVSALVASITQVLFIYLFIYFQPLKKTESI